MPVVSKAQNAAMHAAEEGKSTIGIPKSVGKDFVAASHGVKVSKLPKYANTKHRDSGHKGAHKIGKR